MQIKGHAKHYMFNSENDPLPTPHGVHKSTYALVVLDPGSVFQCATGVHRVGSHDLDGFCDIFRRQAAGEIEFWNDLADLLCNRPVKHPACATAQAIVTCVEHDGLDLIG